MTWRRAIRQGYVVGVSNPKAYMILAAVLPQFVDRASGHVQLQLLLLGLLAFVIGLVFDGAWALARPACATNRRDAAARRGRRRRRRGLDDRPRRRPGPHRDGSR